MYLEDLQNAPPDPAAGRYGRVLRAARERGEAVPELYHLFAARPAAARALGDFMQEVMRGTSELSPGFCELIAAWTSARNRCRF